MATAQALVSAEEFLQMDLEDGNFELVRGEVIELPRAMPEHGRVCMNVGFTLESFGRRTGIGYALSNDMAIQTERGPDTVRGPDVCFFSHVRWPRDHVGRKLPPVPPDLAVEVVSPGNSPGDVLRKVVEYLEVGVLAVWVIYPRRRKVIIHRREEEDPIVLTETDVIEGLPELPGFECPVADFFL